MNKQDLEMVEAFKVLANESRVQILKWLKDPAKNFTPQHTVDLTQVGVCVSQITRKLNMSQPTVSQYLTLLQKAGFVTATRIGKWTYYRRNELKIQSVSTYLEQNF